MSILYYGDNIDILRQYIASESVDLIYLDPPFNSNRNYNLLFKSPGGEASKAQMTAFEDTWVWGDGAALAFDEVMRSGYSEAAAMLNAMRSFLGESDVMAYLSMMAVRLIELHRVLKPTGSIYLHCDPTASHYLKIIMDGIFDPSNYQNEIIWRRTGSHNNAKRFGPIHDVLHFYRKSPAYRHRPVFRPYMKGHVDSYFKKEDEKGKYWTNSIHGAGVRNGESGQPWRGYNPTAKNRHWAIPSALVQELGIDPDLAVSEKLDALDALGVLDLPDPATGSLPTYRQYLHNSPGMLLQDIWAYQPHTRGVLHNTDEAIDEDVRWLTAQGDEERLAYPTQKPVGLLERIVRASSNEGDTVLDPFCGCGTTVDAAQKLARRWIGIDITHLAVGLIERRLKARYPGIAFEVRGMPKDIDGLRAMAEQARTNPRLYYELQYWAINQIPAAQHAQNQKKGADRGIDGIGLPVAKGPKTTLRRNPVSEQDFRRSLVASFWSSKSDFGFDFLDFERHYGLNVGKCPPATGRPRSSPSRPTIIPRRTRSSPSTSRPSHIPRTPRPARRSSGRVGGTGRSAGRRRPAAPAPASRRPRTPTPTG